ncbi:MAG: hypothetical protein Q7R96_01585 [Nanoarchaeota archaeon]|nr:hypothetical protein [Nanoarchaeota archaeon]
MDDRIQNVFLFGRQNADAMRCREFAAKDLSRIPKQAGSHVRVISPVAQDYAQYYHDASLLCVTADAAENLTYVKDCLAKNHPIDRTVLTRNNLPWLEQLASAIYPHMKNGLLVHMVANDPNMLAYYLTRLFMNEGGYAQQITCSSHVDYLRFFEFVQEWAKDHAVRKTIDEIDVHGVVLGTHALPWPVIFDAELKYKYARGKSKSLVDVSTLDRKGLQRKIIDDFKLQIRDLMAIGKKKDAEHATAQMTGRAIGKEIKALLGGGWANMGVYDESYNKLFGGGPPTHLSFPVHLVNGQVAVHNGKLRAALSNPQVLAEVKAAKIDLEKKISELMGGVSPAPVIAVTSIAPASVIEVATVAKPIEKVVPAKVVVKPSFHKVVAQPSLVIVGDQELGYYTARGDGYVGKVVSLERRAYEVGLLNTHIAIGYGDGVELRDRKHLDVPGKMYTIPFVQDGWVNSFSLLDNRLFAAHQNAGLVMWDRSSAVYSRLHTDGCTGVVALKVAGQDYLFFSTRTAAYKFSLAYHQIDILAESDEPIRGIMSAPSGDLWYITKYGSLFMVNPDSGDAKWNKNFRGKFSDTTSLTSFCSAFLDGSPQVIVGFKGGIKSFDINDATTPSYELLPFSNKVTGLAVVGDRILGVNGSYCYAWDRISRSVGELECDHKVKNPLGIVYMGVNHERE